MKENILEQIDILNQYLERQGKEIKDISYIGDIEFIELINEKEKLIRKEIFRCEEKIKDKNGNELKFYKYYTGDLECIAADIEQYGIILENKFKNKSEILNEIYSLEENIEKIKNEENNKEICGTKKISQEEKKSEKIGKEHKNQIKEDEAQVEESKYNNLEKKDDTNVNAIVLIDPNEKITDRDTMATMLGVQEKGYKKIAVEKTKELSDKKYQAEFIFVGITADGKRETIDNLIQAKGNKQNKNINAISADGKSIKDERINSMYEIKGREDEHLAIGFDELNIMKISLVRTSKETNESISIPIEANTTVHTSAEDKEFMNSMKNPKITEETRRIEEYKKENCVIGIKDIEDNADNDIHKYYSEEYIPNTNKTWEEFANECGYRGEGAIDKAKEEFKKQKEKMEGLDNEIIVEEIIEQKEEEYLGNNRIK